MFESDSWFLILFNAFTSNSGTKSTLKTLML